MTVTATAAAPIPPATAHRRAVAVVLDVADRFGPMMLAVAQHILGDAVEAEEALIEALVALRSGDAPVTVAQPDLARLCAWQRQVALRRLQRRLQQAPPAPDLAADDTPDLATATLRHQVVVAALANLPADQQQILQFAYGQGLDPATIGSVQRRPVASVHLALGDALDRLALVIAHLWRRP